MAIRFETPDGMDGDLLNPAIYGIHLVETDLRVDLLFKQFCQCTRPGERDRPFPIHPSMQEANVIEPHRDAILAGRHPCPMPILLVDVQTGGPELLIGEYVIEMTYIENYDTIPCLVPVHEQAYLYDLYGR